MKWKILFLVTLYFGSAAFASPINGDELLRNCRADNVADAGLCIGYISGVLDTFGLWNKVDRSAGGSQICSPKDLTSKLAAEIVVKYLAAHPDELHKSAIAITWAALQKAFPCPAKSP